MIQADKDGCVSQPTSLVRHDVLHAHCQHPPNSKDESDKESKFHEFNQPTFESSMQRMSIGQAMEAMSESTDSLENGNTELHKHVLGQNLKLVEKLVQNYPELVDCCNNDRKTALHLAVQSNNCAIVRLLLRSGANRFIQDQHGNTPLHLACQKCACDSIIASLLLDCRERKAYDYLQNNNGEFCQHVAVKSNNINTLNILVEMGLNINRQELSGGKTILHYAVAKGENALIESILNHPEFVDIPDYREETAAEIAYLYWPHTWHRMIELRPELKQAPYVDRS